MARLLIVGGGRCAVGLAERALGEGHPVRIVTRTERRRAAIEAAGAECWIGDPNRLGTLRGALDGVAVACWLLGCATGSEEQLRALHGPRLRSFLESTIDTTVRGVLYEGAGSVPAALLATGAQVAREVADRNALPLAILRADPSDPLAWLEQTCGALSSILSP